MSQPAPISLCLVVKNEELFLAECLASVRRYVAEMIVVDTGSTDRTLQIAREMGAEVHQASWPGNMAAAHDLPVAHATRPWILTLDGDEVLDPAGAAALEGCVATAQVDGFILPVRNYTFRPPINPEFGDPRAPESHGADYWTPS